MSFTGQIWRERYRHVIYRPSIHPGYYRASWTSQDSPPLVLSDLLLLGAGRSHCVPAQLAEHLRAVKQGLLQGKTNEWAVL